MEIVLGLAGSDDINTYARRANRRVEVVTKAE